MASNYQFYEGLDSFGHLSRVSKRFGRMREVTLNRYNDQLWIHLNDNTNCFGNPDVKFDITQSKSLSFRYEEIFQLRDIIEILQLRDIIDELQPYIIRTEEEMMVRLCFCLFERALVLFSFHH